jgi:hypothetical protein
MLVGVWLLYSSIQCAGTFVRACLFDAGAPVSEKNDV